MLNSLIRLLDDSNLDYLENRLSAGIDRFKKAFGAAFTSLEDKEDHYELALDVADDAKASNVSVNYDDETRELSVEYKYESANYKNTATVIETLPVDADEETIGATVENGKFTLTVWKKVVEDNEPEEEVSDVIVPINRKNRK